MRFWETCIVIKATIKLFSTEAFNVNQLVFCQSLCEKKCSPQLPLGMERWDSCSGLSMTHRLSQVSSHPHYALLWQCNRVWTWYLRWAVLCLGWTTGPSGVEFSKLFQNLGFLRRNSFENSTSGVGVVRAHCTAAHARKLDTHKDGL